MVEGAGMGWTWPMSAAENRPGSRGRIPFRQPAVAAGRLQPGRESGAAFAPPQRPHRPQTRVRVAAMKAAILRLSEKADGAQTGGDDVEQGLPPPPG